MSNAKHLRAFFYAQYPRNLSLSMSIFKSIQYPLMAIEGYNISLHSAETMEWANIKPFQCLVKSEARQLISVF